MVAFQDLLAGPVNVVKTLSIYFIDDYVVLFDYVMTYDEPRRKRSTIYQHNLL